MPKDPRTKAIPRSADGDLRDVRTDDLGWQMNPQVFAQLHDELTKTP